MSKMLDIRGDFFESIVRRRLGYNPRIEIKPAHLANGLFRAICGGYKNNEAQHFAVYPRNYPILDVEKLTNKSLQRKFRQFAPSQQEALTFLHGRERERAMLHSILGADKTVFGLVSTSSYSLSHANHVTNDNHDREAGEWLHRILSRGDNRPAFNLLSELLQQSARDCNDELSVLTIPLNNSTDLPKSRQGVYIEPENLSFDENGFFENPTVRAIREAFDQLAQNDYATAQQNGKLDTLRRFVTLACFAVYFNLANASGSPSYTPMIFRFDHSANTLRQASIRSYQRMLNTIDEMLFQEILLLLQQIAQDGSYGSWNTDEEIENRIHDTINWHRTRTAESRTKETTAVKRLKDDCIQFYRNYRGKTANYSPLEALARSLTNMLGLVLSSTPQDVARGLGNRIGLLSQYSEQQRKTYDPHPDFLEVLVRASIPRKTQKTLSELAEIWANSFGILCGVLGDENDRISSLGVVVDQEEWLSNANTLADLLEMSGYARRYADGVVLVTVE